LMLSGAVLVVAGMWFSGRAVPHSVYNPQRFTAIDVLSVISSIVIAALLLAPNLLLSQQSLLYYPYPRLTAPVFDPVAGMLMLFWLLPLAALRSTTNSEERP
jgi:hypothetical protein